MRLGGGAGPSGMRGHESGIVRATVSGPPDRVRFTIETWECRVAAMAPSRWGSVALLADLRTQIAVLDDGSRSRSACVAATMLTATRCGVASPSG